MKEEISNVTEISYNMWINKVLILYDLIHFGKLPICFWCLLTQGLGTKKTKNKY